MPTFITIFFFINATNRILLTAFDESNVYIQHLYEAFFGDHLTFDKFIAIHTAHIL